MKKKTIEVLLLASLVMILSIAAISAADADDTFIEELSDTNIETSSVTQIEEDSADSLYVSDSGNDTRNINVNDNLDDISYQDDVSNQNVISNNRGESDLNKAQLSSSNDKILKASSNCFYVYDTATWYEDLRTAMDAIKDRSSKQGTIGVLGGTYTERDATTDGDIYIHFSSEATITIQPFSENDEVIFDGSNNNYLFWLDNANLKVTFNNIMFTKGKATEDGGAIEVMHAQVTLNNCRLYQNNAGRYGGAVSVSEGGSFKANNCSFFGNTAKSTGGAISCEDDGTVSLNGCYFFNNKVSNDGIEYDNDFGYEDGSDNPGEWEFDHCNFAGNGEIDFEVYPVTKSIDITPVVLDDINYVVLYDSNDEECARKPCNSGDTATFEDLDAGTYTIYLMKNEEKRYAYSNTEFTIKETYFILNNEFVFETLEDAVNAITIGTTENIITVENGTWTGSHNFNIDLTNKGVTIMPQDISEDAEPVIFSSDSRNYLLSVGSNAQLILSHIYVTGKFNDAALKFTSDLESTISDCIFNNTLNSEGNPGTPIDAENSNLVLSDSTFESNGQTLFKNTAVNIDGSTFTSNTGSQGGAINADSTSVLTITDSEFSLNEASDKGGAIYATNLYINDTEFIGNTAPIGAGVYITDLSDSEINITRSVFDTNIATSYRNIYSESLTRTFNFESNEYDLILALVAKDGAYGREYILDGTFDWGSNLDNNNTFLFGFMDDGNLFGDLVTIVDNEFKLNMGLLSGGTHNISMAGMYTQEDSLDHFLGHDYYNDANGNQFYLGLGKVEYLEILIEKAKIALTLEVENVLIPEVPVLNLYANYDENFTVYLGTTIYQVQVVDGKASLELTGLDLGKYTVVAMRNADENFDLAVNFTTFTVGKTYSNFLVVSTNVEYATLAEAVANSDDFDTIFVKNGTYADTGVVISDKSLDIIALGNAIFDAQGKDANFIIINETAEANIIGITFRGIHNRNTNYGAIVNHGILSLDSCDFIDNTITKTSFAENGGAAIFNDGHSLDIENCNFINNVAPLKASTAAVTSLSYEDVTITSSKFINNSAREGGALHFKNIAQFEPAVVSSEFEGNIAVKGSAIYLGDNSSYLSVSLSNFVKNDIKNNLGEDAQLEGGVIYVNSNSNESEATLDISSSNFENNSNSKVDGGAICLDGASNGFIDTCIFNNNSGNQGSAIFIKNPYDEKAYLLVHSSNFVNNNASIGAIVSSPKITTLIEDSLFANNTGEYRNIYSNGFTVVHDSVLDVINTELNVLSVDYGESAVINGTADYGTNLNALANLTVADENITVEIKNNTFSYETDVLESGKYFAVFNDVVDINNNTYVMDDIIKIFRVKNVDFDLNVSVDNITYGETLRIVETLPSYATGTIQYYLDGKYYTKEEVEALKLDAGEYKLVAIYNIEDSPFTYSVIDFTVYKANPSIFVADVEVGSGENVTVIIVTNVPSNYIIEIGDYKNVTLVNGSKAFVVEKAFEPGTYTIKVTSQERVNYNSSSVEATLKVNANSLGQSSVSPSSVGRSPVGDSPISNAAEDNSIVNSEDNVISQNEDNSVVNSEDTVVSQDAPDSKSNAKKNRILIAPKVGEDYEEGNFIYQLDEESDYEYFDTLEEAIDEAALWGEGIITVRGGTYSGAFFCGIDIEGEVELTIKAFEDEEVIFDCEGENYFLHLTYDTEVEWTETAPPIPIVYTTEGPSITLEGITVINGYNYEGGAIELVAGTLTLTNCNFYHNHAEDYGGAICIGSMDSDQDATLVALNCTFNNNTAGEEGGAIYIEADLEQYSSASFAFCTFLDNYQDEGEGLHKMNYFAGPETEEITSQYCLFNGTGEITGFAIDKIEQTVTVNGTSTDKFDSVVLLYFTETPLYTIYNNGSQKFDVMFEDVMGGNYTLGLMNDHDFNTYLFGEEFEVKVPNFIISEDEVFENLTDAIDAVVENGIIYANMNYHDEENLAIDITKSFTLKNFRDRMVVFDGSAENWFFTIAEGCNVVIDGIYFTDGGIKNSAAIENYGTLTLKNCSFESFETGSAIYNSGLLNIVNSSFSFNFVNYALIRNDGQLVIDEVEFANNTFTTGSAVYNNGPGEIKNTNFTSNYNDENGGAIYNSNSLLLNNTVFIENEGKNGGAIYNTGTLNVYESNFEDNSATEYGGAIFNGNELNIIDSTFTGSSCEIDGGAVYNNGTMFVNNTNFVGNSATRGGAIYNKKSLVITGSTFGINIAEDCANIYNDGDIQFSENVFDFYDVILDVPDGEYGLPTTITGTLNPEFNMDIQVTLPGFVNNNDATVIINEGIFEYTVDVLPKGIYDVKLDEILYDQYGNIYYGEAIYDRLIINKANVYINLAVDNVILPAAPVLNISTSKDGTFTLVYNNNITIFNITGGSITLDLEAVEEGNYTVMVFREGDENYNDAVNSTTFSVGQYDGNFIVNSTGYEYDTLSEAIAASCDDDIIYVKEGNYTGSENIGLSISNKKLSIIAIDLVIFDADSSDLSFLTIDENADVTISDLIITGFKDNDEEGVILNNGNLTVEGCTFINNILGQGTSRGIINNRANLTVIESLFCDNELGKYAICSRDRPAGTESNIIISESRFENNTLSQVSLIRIEKVASAKITSNAFVNNILADDDLIEVFTSGDVLIDSEFYNNTINKSVIFASSNSNLIVNNSVFTGNTADKIIDFKINENATISESIFTENVLTSILSSYDKDLSIDQSTFSYNTISLDNGVLIVSDRASINGSVFTYNTGADYRNIYSGCDDLNVTNSVFDAINVDFNVSDIGFGENETIEGTFDIGTNYDFTINLNINNKTYSANVSDNRFTFTSGGFKGGDYYVTINPMDNNSNTYIFDKVTRIFTVDRIDPGLKVIIENITVGEKLEVIYFIANNTSARIVYDLNGTMYTSEQLENLTLDVGEYLIIAQYPGDKNYLPAMQLIDVKVSKISPNITVNDTTVGCGEDINIDVAVDVPDYYTVFIGSETRTLYVEDSATFTFSNLNLEPGTYEIKVYVFETDDYAEAYAFANLTVNNRTNSSVSLDDIVMDYGEIKNATAVTEGATAITAKIGDLDIDVIDNFTIQLSDLDAGNYTLTVTTVPDAAHNPVSITVNVTVNKINSTLAIEDVELDYGEIKNATAITEGATAIVAEIDGEAVSVDNFTVIIPLLSAGTHELTVTTVPDDNHLAVSQTVTITVNKVNSTLAVEGAELDYGESKNITAITEGATGIVAEIDGTPVDVDDFNVLIADLSAGTHNLTVTTVPDENHTAVSQTVTITVNKINSTLAIEDLEIDYGESKNVTAITEGASGITALIDGTPVDVDDFNVLVSTLDAGTHNLTVTTVPDENHTAVSQSVNITVNKVNSTLAVEDVEMAYGESKNVTAVTEGATAIVAKVDGEAVAIDEFTIILSGLSAGTHNLTVTTVPDENHLAVTQSATITVYNASSTLTIEDIEFDYNSTGSAAVSYTGATGVTAVIDGHDEAVITIKENKITVSGLDPGNYTISVTTIPDEDHKAVTKTANVIVNKLVTEIVSNSVIITIYNVTNNLEISLKDIKGNPISNAVITVDLIGEKNYTTDANGQVKVPIKDMDAGNYTAKIVYGGSDIYMGSNTSADITINKLASQLTANNIITQYDTEDFLIATLKDGEGNPIAGAELSLDVGDKVSYTTDANGQIKVSTKGLDAYSYNVTITYEGDKNYYGSSVNSLVVINKIKTKIIFKNMKTTAFESAIEGRVGDYFNFQLVDEYGTPLANKPVKIGFNGKVYNKTTNATGVAKLQINLKVVNLYTFAIAFLGDNNYEGSFEVALINVTPQTPKFTTANKSYKATAKTKSLTATLKSTRGKAIAGRKVIFTVNGKKYTAKTNSKGIATVKVSLSKKGTYSFTAKFAGDKTYKAISKKGKLTIK